MTELIVGTVIGESEDGRVTISCPVPANIIAWSKQNPTQVLIKFEDGRKASPEQVKKAHALIGDIAEWSGDWPEYLKTELKRKFILERLDDMESDMFSFKDCSVEKARLFITFLIDLMIEYGIPSKVPLWEHAEDIQAYVYACCMNRVCAACGRKGVDLHHVIPIGMGADRKNKPQLGWPVLPLCREHHTRMHTDSKKFLKKYHLEAIPLTDDIAKVYGFSRKARRPASEFSTEGR